jgi:translation initiation factor 3 subunit L
VPDPIKKFLSYFRDMIHDGNGFEVANLYEVTFPKLTEEYFKSSPWPGTRVIPV